MLSIKDQTNQTITLQNAPQRIVSVVPSQTELLYDLGLENEIVGITKFCVHPNKLRTEKSIVGGTKKLHIAKIQALNPDIIIANKEENAKEDIEALQKLYPVYISDITTLKDAFQMINDLGYLCQKENSAHKLVHNISKAFENLKPNAQKRVAYLIWHEPVMVASNGTFIHEMLSKCGFINVFEKNVRYPEITENVLKAANPDVILLSSEPFPFKDKHLTKYRNIYPNAYVKLVDGELFSWYGSRLLQSPAYFEKIIQSLREK